MITYGVPCHFSFGSEARIYSRIRRIFPYRKDNETQRIIQTMHSKSCWILFQQDYLRLKFWLSIWLFGLSGYIDILFIIISCLTEHPFLLFLLSGNPLLLPLKPISFYYPFIQPVEKLLST